MAKESRDEELGKLAYEAQYLQSQLQEVQRQLQQALMLSNEMKSTVGTLDGLKELKNETFFQIGSGAFLKGNASESKTILIDAGSGVYVERKPEEAKEMLQKRKQNLEKAIAMLKDNAAQIAKRLQEIELRAEELQ